jgi:hypothetical protein
MASFVGQWRCFDVRTPVLASKVVHLIMALFVVHGIICSSTKWHHLQASGAVLMPERLC